MIWCGPGQGVMVVGKRASDFHFPEAMRVLGWADRVDDLSVKGHGGGEPGGKWAGEIVSLSRLFLVAGGGHHDRRHGGGRW